MILDRAMRGSSQFLVFYVRYAPTVRPPLVVQYEYDFASDFYP